MDADTLAAPEASTLAAETTDAVTRPRARAASTNSVLPDIVRDGESITLVPREAERYRVERELGRGGMGEVSLATDQDIGRQVAVKRLLAQQPATLARFVDEVRTIGRLEHPNIVPIHDVGVDAQGRFFFVMKFVDGETLATIIRRLGECDAATHARFGFEQRLDIFIGLVRALQFAHERNVIHRDIKPDNIMVGRFGEVMVMDWGIAREIGAADEALATEHALASGRASETKDGALIGTPMYMSPEQAGGETVQLDARSDLYSAFAVLFELLTLRHYLRDTKSVMDVLVKVQEQGCPGVSDTVYAHDAQEAVPTELRHFLIRGLSLDKAARFESAAEVLAELHRIRAGDFRVQCPVTFMKRGNSVMGRFMDAHPTRSIALASTLVLVALGSVVGLATMLLLR
jgi:serine/threonine-protein kinase